MDEPMLVPDDPVMRLRAVMDLSWCVLISRFVGGRHFIETEAPFQHHFANIIRTVGELYCTERRDQFFVDLETKHENVRDKSKYFDITCGYANVGVSCAVELKFKTARQGAQDNGRIDAYVDIEALEFACDMGYSFGRFYMITNSTTYLTASSRGVGTVFAMHDGHVSEPGLFHYPSRARQEIQVNLRGAYSFDWTCVRDWRFLALDVNSKKLSDSI